MKRVSFEVAKYLKEVGYPQGVTEKVYLLKDYEKMKENWVIFKEKCMHTDFIADMPTYFEVWLWLWREKKKWIDVSFSLDEAGWTFMQNPSPCDCGLYNDPEEAIEAAIKYLVENNLIK